MGGIGGEDGRELGELGVGLGGECGVGVVAESGVHGGEGGFGGRRGKSARDGEEEAVARIFTREVGAYREWIAAGSEAPEGGARAGDVALVGVGVEVDGGGAAGGGEETIAGEVEAHPGTHLAERVGT